MSNTVDILIQVRAQLAALQQTVDGMRRVGAAAGEAQRASSGLASIFAAGGAFGLGQMSIQGLAGAIMGAATASIRYRAELEQQTVAFRSLLGTVEAAQERMLDLESFAAATPFELPEIVRASRILQSLTDGALARGDGLRIVGDAAAAAGRSFDETAMWVGRLYSGLQSGTPVGEATMRLMEMGLVSGETARRLNEMAERGLATGRAMDVIRETFGKTAGAMELQSQTLNGMLSTLSDTLKSIGSDAVAPAVDKMKELLAVTLEVLGALDRAEDRRQKINDVSLAALRRAAAPTSEGDRQAQLKAAEDGIQQARARLVELRDLQAQQEAATQDLAVKSLGAGGLLGLFLADRQATSQAEQLTAEMEALVMQVKAYEAVTRSLRSSRGQDKAAAAEVLTLEKQIEAEKAKSAKDATEWLVKNQLASRAAVEEYQRSLLPLGDQRAALEGLLEAEEFLLNHRLSGARSTEEAMKIQLETDQRLIAVKKELAEIIRKMAADEQHAAADAQRARRDETRLGLRESSRGLDDRQAELSVASARLDADFTKTRLEKRAEGIRLQRESIGLIDEEIGRLQALRDAESDPSIREDVSRSIDGLKRQRRGAVAELERVEGGPDPNSVRDQMKATLNEMESRLPTLAEGIADTFRTTVGTAVSSISSGITGIIMKTQSWQQALVSIGNTIATTVVQSIVEMGVRWITTRALVGAANILWSGKEALAAAPKALMESISSYGVAALVGAAAFAAIMAGVGAFADGGYVSGPGGPRDDRIMARLSNGEYVVNAQATAENRPLLEAINSGRGIDVAPAGPTVNVGAAPVSVVVVNSREEMLRVLESTEGQKTIFDSTRRRRTDLGVAT